MYSNKGTKFNKKYKYQYPTLNKELLSYIGDNNTKEGLEMNCVKIV